MPDIRVYTDINTLPKGLNQKALCSFIHDQLGRFRDEISAISKCLDYVFSPDPARGGFLLLALEGDMLIGATVLVRTGMQKFIPGYFLIYIAVDEMHRGRGIGSAMIERAFGLCDDDIALHVEYDNPAKQLYERLGFGSKYAEMRWRKA